MKELQSKDGLINFRFKESENIEDEITPDRMNAIVDAINSNAIVRVINGFFSGKGRGKTLVCGGGGGSSPSSLKPFAVSIRPNPTDPTGETYQAKVNVNSDLVYLNPFGALQYLSITGLDTWFPFLATDVIAVYIAVTDYFPVSATVQSWGQGNTGYDPHINPWDPSDFGYLVNDHGSPPVQVGASIPLGYSNPDSKGAPFWVQMQDQHLYIEENNIQGQPCVYDFSHRRRLDILPTT